MTLLHALNFIIVRGTIRFRLTKNFIVCQKSSGVHYKVPVILLLSLRPRKVSVVSYIYKPCVLLLHYLLILQTV